MTPRLHIQPYVLVWSPSVQQTKLRRAWSENSNQDTNTQTNTHTYTHLCPFYCPPLHVPLKGHRREWIIPSYFDCRALYRPTHMPLLQFYHISTKQSLTDKQIDKQPALVVLFRLCVSFCPRHLRLCFDSPCILPTDQCCDLAKKNERHVRFFFFFFRPSLTHRPSLRGKRLIY